MASPYDLTVRSDATYPRSYPHSQFVNDTSVKTVSAIFHGPDATVLKGSAIATNDVFELIDVPAGAYVLFVTAQVTTAEGGTCTFDIGDAATVDGYFDGVEGNALTHVNSFDGASTEAFGDGKLYTAADTIDLKLITGTAANLVVKLTATYVMTNSVAV
jgi:hypothetical protein